MALSTGLLVLGLVLLQAPAHAPRGGRAGRLRRASGALALAAGVGAAVLAHGAALGLTCAAVLTMLVAPLLALCTPLWPRATRVVLPAGAAALALLWLGGA